MQSSKQGLWKGYFFVKKKKKNGKGLDLVAEPPRINICWVSPPPDEKKSHFRRFRINALRHLLPRE